MSTTKKVSVFITAEVLQHKSDIDNAAQQKYEENEVHGKFRITSEQWSEQLEDRNSREFSDLSNTLTTGLQELLEDDEELKDKADFDIEIVKLT